MKTEVYINRCYASVLMMRRRIGHFGMVLELLHCRVSQMLR